jgi:hypothetical protein
MARDDDDRRRRNRRSGQFSFGFATMRDLLSFLAGMGIIAHEVLVSETVDPYAIGVGVALTGLPIVFGGGGDSKGRPK